MRTSIARVVLTTVGFVLCAGFVPAGACAKGCKGCATAGDDVARVGTRSTSHLDDLARSPRVVAPPGAGLAHAGTELGETTAHLSRAALDDAVAALPEPRGAISKLASKPSPNGARLRFEARKTAGKRSLGADYARTIKPANIEPQQHEWLIDALDAAQTIVEALGGADDEEDRAKIARAAELFDRRAKAILTSEQYEIVRANLGEPHVIVYRLATEKPIARAAAPAP